MNTDPPKSFTSSRTFELWKFEGFHWQILFRSPRGKERPFNIDVVFSGVSFMQVEFAFKGLTIRRATDDERKSFASTRTLFSSEILVQIESQMRCYYVVCGGFAVYENSLPLSESPLTTFREEDQVPFVAYGDKLAFDWINGTQEPRSEQSID